MSHVLGSSERMPFLPISAVMWNLTMSYSPLMFILMMRPVFLSAIAEPLTSCVLYRFGRNTISALLPVRLVIVYL